MTRHASPGSRGRHQAGIMEADGDSAILCRQIERGMEEDLTFPQIIDGLSAPIATLTADGRVEFANKQLLDYLGMSLE
jgi:PAS domain-containing protein